MDAPAPSLQLSNISTHQGNKTAAQTGTALVLGSMRWQTQTATPSNLMATDCSHEVNHGHRLVAQLDAWVTAGYQPVLFVVMNRCQPLSTANDLYQA